MQTISLWPDALQIAVLVRSQNRGMFFGLGSMAIPTSGVHDYIYILKYIYYIIIYVYFIIYIILLYVIYYIYLLYIIYYILYIIYHIL